MFRKLGMGIRMSLQDDFTPKAKDITGTFTNMKNSAKEMVDNIDNEMIRLNAVLTSAFALDKLGRNVESFGRRIVRVFKDVGSQVVNTGSMMENYMITYSSLYKDEKVAREKIDWAVEMGKTTPFESTEVLEAMIGLKASGIDVDKEYTASDGTTKTLLEFIGDMGALRPDQGLGGAMWAFRNLIGGQARSFITRFDMNPEQILGRKMNLKGTPEDIAQDFVEIASRVAPNLLTGMEGTWGVIMSNLDDFKFELMRGIAESGLFEEVKSTLTYVQQRLEETDLIEKGKTISDILKTLFKPVGALVRQLTDLAIAALEFAETHPEVAKFFGVFVGGIGILTTISGKFLSLSSSILISLTMLKMYGREAKLTGSFLGGTGLAFESLLGLLAKTVLSLGLFYIAYKENIFGIKDITDNVFEDVGQKFRKFWLRLQVLAKALFQDEGGKVFFEEDLVRALKENDLWEFTQNVVGLKGHLTEFFGGFTEGVKEVFEGVKEAFEYIEGKLGFIFKDKDDDGKGGLTARLNKWLGDDKDIEGVGKKVGKVITTLVLVRTAFKLAKGILGLAGGILGFGKSITPNKKGFLANLLILGGKGARKIPDLFKLTGRGARKLFYGGKSIGGGLIRGLGKVLYPSISFGARTISKLIPKAPTIATSVGIGKSGYDIYRGIKDKDKDRRYKGIAELSTIGIGTGIGAGLGGLLAGPVGALAGAKIGSSAGSIVSMIFGDRLGAELQEGVELVTSKLDELTTWTDSKKQDIKENWDSFLSDFAERREGAKENWDAFLSDMSSKIAEKWNDFREKGSEIRESFSSFFGGLREVVEGKVREMKEHLDGFLEFITSIPSRIKSGLDTGKERVKNWLGFGGGKSNADSSNWGGLSYVPRDNYKINAHRGEMLLSRKEADLLRNGAKSNRTSSASVPNSVDNSVNIDRLEIVLPQAEGTSREDARQLALMVLEEIERLKVQSNIRNHYEYVR